MNRFHDAWKHRYYAFDPQSAFKTSNRAAFPVWGRPVDEKATVPGRRSSLL